jgi:hypothetical protein
MMKRVMAAVLILMAAVSVFAGGNKDSESKSGTASR